MPKDVPFLLGENIHEYVERNNLWKMSTEELALICNVIISENPKVVEDFRTTGNKKLINYITGLVIKRTGPRASAKEVNEIVDSMLSAKDLNTTDA